MHHKIKYTFVFLILCKALVCQAQNHIVVINILSDNGHYKVTPRLSFMTSKKIKEAIDNGIRLQIIVKAELIEPHSWWFDTVIESQMQVLEVDYLSLGKLYVVKNKKTGEQLGFNDYKRLWKEFQKLIKFNFQKKTTTLLAVKMRLMLDKGALPTAMQLPVLFDSDWEINTQWYTQRIVESE